MQKIAIILTISLAWLSAGADALAIPKDHKDSEFKTERPKPNDQQRLERRSTAYKKSASQALNKKPLESTCYYTMSGCSEEVNNKDGSLISAERPPRQYPQNGYLLGNDGLYHFNSSAINRD